MSYGIIRSSSHKAKTVAGEFLVINFEVRHCAALLTYAVVLPEDLIAKVFV